MKILAILSASIALAAALDFSNSFWIWTNELPSPGGFVPLGPRAFRRFVPSPQGVSPVLANVLLTADNAYTLFINGKEIGSGADFHTAQAYCVPLCSPCGTVIAVTATNLGDTPNPAGVLAKVEITYSDGSQRTIVSDSSWKAFNSPNIPSGYNVASFDDGSWPNAVPEGVVGDEPWGPVTLPSGLLGSDSWNLTTLSNSQTVLQVNNNPLPFTSCQCA